MLLWTAAEATTLRVAIDAEPEGLDPLLHHHSSGKLLLQHLGESLVAYREDLTVAPALAERIERSDDGRVYRFRIRTGARFHNGAEVTADDVAWTWQAHYLDPRRPWDCRVYYDGTGSTEERTSGVKVVSVRPTDPRTVEFMLAEPSSLFLHRLADTTCAPLVFHRDSVAADGSWLTFIGTGPFRLQRWERGQPIRLEKFADYLPGIGPRDGYAGGRAARVDAVELVVLETPALALAALADGRVHVLPDVDEDTYVAGRQLPGTSGQVTALTSWYDLLIQTSDPLLSDVRVRQAIAHALDLDYIAQVVTEGRQAGNPSIVPIGAKFHTPAHDRRRALDTARARALLAAAGYCGQPLKLQTSRDAYPRLHEAALIVRSMLRAVGLDVELELLPWKEQLDGGYRTGRFQLSLFLFGGRNSPTLSYGKFIGAKQQLARFQWDDDTALKWVQSAEAAGSDAELQSTYDALHDRMIDTVPTIALFNDERFDVVRAEVTGYRPSRFMRVALWGVEVGP